MSQCPIHIGQLSVFEFYKTFLFTIHFNKGLRSEEPSYSFLEQAQSDFFVFLS